MFPRRPASAHAGDGDTSSDDDSVRLPRTLPLRSLTSRLVRQPLLLGMLLLLALIGALCVGEHAAASIRQWRQTPLPEQQLIGEASAAGLATSHSDRRAQPKPQSLDSPPVAPLAPLNFSALDRRLAVVVSSSSSSGVSTCNGNPRPVRMAEEMGDVGTVLSACFFHGEDSSKQGPAERAWDEANPYLHPLHKAGEDVSCYPARPPVLHSLRAHPPADYAQRPSGQGLPLDWPAGDTEVMHVVPRVLAVASATAHPLGALCRDDWVLAPWSCTVASPGGVPSVAPLAEGDIRKHDMAVLLSEYWGNEPYHFQAEVLPRLAVMLPFVLARPDVQMAVTDFDDNKGKYMLGMLRVLGVSSSRVVSSAVHARLLLVPESVHCGNPYALQTDFLRRAVWLALDARAAEGAELGRPLTPEDTTPPARLLAAFQAAPYDYVNRQPHAFSDPENVQLLMVYRTGRSRGLVEAEKLLQALHTQLPSNVHVRVFNDSGRGFRSEAWPQFRQADLVLAPHGSALAHQFASRIGTAIVEVANSEWNACFAKTSVKMGLRHHLLAHKDRLASNDQLHVEVDEVVQLVKTIIHEALAEYAARKIPVGK